VRYTKINGKSCASIEDAGSSDLDVGSACSHIQRKLSDVQSG
jgi:hypothetical protein